MTMKVDREDDVFVVDAGIVGTLLGVPAIKVQQLMRSGHITSVCEKGVEGDHGRFRLNFFYRNRKARVRVDAAGRVLSRSVVDLGDGPAQGAPRPSGP